MEPTAVCYLWEPTHNLRLYITLLDIIYNVFILFYPLGHIL